MARIRKTQEYKTTVADAVSDACNDLVALGEELREWYDNMPEGLQGGDKSSMVDEAASTLENLSEPDVPDSIGELVVEYSRYVKKGYMSRSARCNECIDLLNEVISRLTDDPALEDNSDCDQLVSDIEELIGEAEGVEFPGMYG